MHYLQTERKLAELQGRVGVWEDLGCDLEHLGNSSGARAFAFLLAIEYDVQITIDADKVTWADAHPALPEEHSSLEQAVRYAIVCAVIDKLEAEQELKNGTDE